jgi:hypothetical protein
MEYVEGVNLRQAMRDGKLTPEQAMKIVPQVCEALQYAHDRGVVHRDIKPENILLDAQGRVKIADFGLAKMLARAPMQVTLTADQQVMGTLHYMAPEQMEKPLTVDHRADIYALGVVFYELLTGELPLGRFDPPSQKARVDARLDEVVMRALAREPDRRYQQISEVKTLLEALVSNPGMIYRKGFGFFEYRSRRTLFGLPLVHIVSGRDPRTGLPRVAKGIVAMGDVSLGVLSIGGIAFGGLTFGGIGVGVVTIGGLAIALLAALGGAAVAGGLAMGGMAVGYVALGGSAFGAQTFSGDNPDPETLRLLGRIFVDWWKG